MNGSDYKYQSNSNYLPALSSCTTMGVAQDSQGSKMALFRQCGGKSYVVVNPHDVNKVEKYGAFSIRAAVRPPYAGYGGYGCRCGANCGCNCLGGGPCRHIMGVT
jgi:hypothetical protein